MLQLECGIIFSKYIQNIMLTFSLTITVNDETKKKLKRSAVKVNE